MSLPLQQQQQNYEQYVILNAPQGQQSNFSWMIPIGQSLSVYSAIAAQAGVATYPPSTTVDNNVTNAYQQYMSTATNSTNATIPLPQAQLISPP